MDGNQRWAKQNKIKIADGYIAGLNNLKRIISKCVEYKINYLTVFAMSTENIRRTSSNIIFNVLKSHYENLFIYFKEKNISIKILGEKENLPREIDQIISGDYRIKNKPLINLNVAFNYGTQYEIKHIINKIKEKNYKNIDTKTIKSFMYLANIPDPDLLIRTGGYSRLSNFIMLNLSYTELFFTKTLWPDFNTKEFNNIINKFNKIARKYGL